MKFTLETVGGNRLEATIYRDGGEYRVHLYSFGFGANSHWDASKFDEAVRTALSSLHDAALMVGEAGARRIQRANDS